MIEHARQIQLRVEEPEESEDDDSGGQFGDTHAIGGLEGHPGSTRPGTWTPLTQTGQYWHTGPGAGAGPGAGPGADTGPTVVIGEPLINFL